VIIEQDMNDTGAVGVQDDEVQEIYDTNMIQSTGKLIFNYIVYTYLKN